METGHGSKPVQTMTYTIKKGDTLWSIANELGVNLGALSRWNNLYPETKLMPGDKLKIQMTQLSVLPEGSRGKRAEKK